MFLSNAIIKAKYLTSRVSYLKAFRYKIRLKSDETGRKAEGSQPSAGVWGPQRIPV
jgi:hypothetical protein